MAKTRVLITVKTYPNLSTKYDELVCTAGFLEDGRWIRIFPMPFRKLDYANQYKKYDWLEIDLVKNTSDFRPESFRPANIEYPGEIVGHINTDNNWDERKGIVLKKVYTDMTKLIKEAKDKTIGTSLAVFKPTKILNFTYKPHEKREYDKAKLEKGRQQNLFEKRDNNFEVVRKLPYKFSFHFEDVNGKVSKLMIEDWETGQLFWKQFAKYNDEKMACEDVKKKYLDDFAKTKDLYFFLGTTKLNHYVSRNPFIIIGAFQPKKETQIKMAF